ncbi:MAG: glycosyltransferase, partial [Chloroflexi bacterium]|nr:glycosyltransferase [Chloroflexota bacterium]
MKVLVVLTYYRPHTSGLTIYAERLAKAMVKRGHQVTILTSQYEQSLAKEEVIDGVKVVRAPVLFRISKGVVMPTFGWLATKLVLDHDVIHLHLPQLDAAGVALRGRIFKKPTVITYHCDLQMPHGLLSWAANQGVNLMNHLAAFFSHRIVAYTNDYASHSSLLKHYAKKIEIINPPVELPEIESLDIKHFEIQHNPESKRPV